MTSAKHADALVLRYAATLSGDELRARLIRHARTISGTDPSAAVELIDRANAPRNAREKLLALKALNRARRRARLDPGVAEAVRAYRLPGKGRAA